MPLISSFGGVDGGSGAAGAASEVIQENCTHLPDACEPPPPLPWKRLLVHMLELPGHHVRDVDGEGAKLDDRHHVRPERVADHHELFGLDAAALEHSAIGVRVLLAEDLDAEKHLAQPRPGELALLVEQVAFGDKQQVVSTTEPTKRLFDTNEKHGRLHHHLLPPAQLHVEVHSRLAG